MDCIVYMRFTDCCARQKFNDITPLIHMQIYVKMADNTGLEVQNISILYLE